jgi:hypothetical protein
VIERSSEGASLSGKETESLRVSTGTCKYLVADLTEKLSPGARKFHCKSECVQTI